MTTFVAIIFGMSLAGFTKDWFGAAVPGEPDQIWIAFSICVGIAIVGTLTSLLIRPTPVAAPDLKATPSDWWIGPDMRAELKVDRPLLTVLLVSSTFWLVGVVVQTSVNEIGKGHFQLNNTRTSFLAACMGLGIAIGCVVAGRISKSVLPNRLVKIGTWGLVLTLATIVTFPAAPRDPAAPANAVLNGNGVATGANTAGNTADKTPDADDAGSANAAASPAVDDESIPQTADENIRTRPQVTESFWAMMIPATQSEFLARGLLLLLGFSAGLFVVPMQVFLQARPPENLKGRMIGAMNLVNWVAIVIGSVLGGLLFALLKSLAMPLTWTWFVMAVFMLPVALFYRLPAEANVLAEQPPSAS